MPHHRLERLEFLLHPDHVKFHHRSTLSQMESDSTYRRPSFGKHVATDENDIEILLLQSIGHIAQVAPEFDLPRFVHSGMSTNIAAYEYSQSTFGSLLAYDR